MAGVACRYSAELGFCRTQLLQWSQLCDRGGASVIATATKMMKSSPAAAADGAASLHASLSSRGS